MRRTTARHRRNLLLACTALLAVTAGCSRMQTGPVVAPPLTGLVTLNDKPVAGAIVQYCFEFGCTRVDQDVTGADGRFEVGPLRDMGRMMDIGMKRPLTYGFRILYAGREFEGYWERGASAVGPSLEFRCELGRAEVCSTGDAPAAGETAE